MANKLTRRIVLKLHKLTVRTGQRMQTVRGGITVIIVLMADGNEVQELREQIYQAKQVVKRIKDGMFSVLNGD